MKPANWKQIKTALADAMELASETREEFVSSLDPEIRAQVRRYLRAVIDARDFMTTPALIDRGLVDQNTHHPAQVDDFRILHPIGSGGMGTVYLAEHAGDGFKQLVALKLIKRGMDTSAVLKRFLMERRILAELVRHAQFRPPPLPAHRLLLGDRHHGLAFAGDADRLTLDHRPRLAAGGDSGVEVPPLKQGVAEVAVGQGVVGIKVGLPPGGGYCRVKGVVGLSSPSLCL